MTKKERLIARITVLLNGAYESEREARNARLRIYRARASLAALDPYHPVHAKVLRVRQDSDGKWRVIDAHAEEKGDIILEELEKWLSQP